MANEIIKIIQLTDTHLFSTDKGILYSAVRCNQVFDQVMQQIKKNELGNAQFIFLTGDVSQDKSKESYEFIAAKLQALNLPVYWIPGNHDNFPLMKEVFRSASHFVYSSRLSLSNWEFIFLNTQILGDMTGAGRLSADQMNLLEYELHEIRELNKSIAVVLHHQVAPVGTPFIDRLMLQNHDKFLEKLRGTNVKLVINGHVHNDYQLHQDGIAFESSPATCLQFTKGAVKFSIEKKSGYKVYYFQKNTYQAIAKFL